MSTAWIAGGWLLAALTMAAAQNPKAGGGGRVIGESDHLGAYPRSQPVTPADIHAAARFLTLLKA